jgi:hypothetical protein
MRKVQGAHHKCLQRVTTLHRKKLGGQALAHLVLACTANGRLVHAHPHKRADSAVRDSQSSHIYLCAAGGAAMASRRIDHKEPEIGNCHRPLFVQRRDPASEVAP